MKFQFSTKDVAEGFCDALDDPDFDVAAHAEDDGTVDVLGLDDHPTYASEIRRMAAAAGGTEIAK
jgi:hypothetical protein